MSGEHVTERPEVPAARRPAGYGPCVLLKHGEIFLKGRNRRRFTERLQDNLRIALRGVGGSTWIKTAQNVTVLGGQVPREVLVERALGARVREAVPALRVDLTAPELTLTVEIDRKETYLSCERLPGLSGLPVGSSGRALVLLSGGYDSPVAAHRAMRRGLAC
uniref:THUMP domain-containing protein n=1 Tax=Streptomyces sp. NRRL F-5065 TaxID=1463855 RepID=UPI0004BEC807